MVHLEAEFVTHPFMSVIEALLFAMRLQQQCDFVIISAVYNVYIGDGMIIVLSVSTLLFYSLEYSIHFLL